MSEQQDRRWEEPPMIRRHFREFGYRDTDLLLFAFIWTLFGFELYSGIDPDPTHKVPLEYLGEGFRSAVWFASASVAIVVAFLRDHDHWGYGALMVPVALRVFSYGFAWAYGVADVAGFLDMLHLPAAPLADVGAWRDSLLWVAIGAFVYRAAKRPELPDLPDEDGRWPWSPAVETSTPDSRRRLLRLRGASRGNR